MQQNNITPAKKIENHININKQNQEELQIKSMENYLFKATKLVKERKFDDLNDHLTKNKPIIINESNRIQIAPYTLEDLKADLSITLDGLETGFVEIDKLTRIGSEAITLVAGRPSHGKTTFMLNLFLNMIIRYPKFNFYFFSYEETRQQIAIKIINILSGYVLDQAQNILQIQGYLKCGSTKCNELEKGKKIYSELVTQGRLYIIESTDNVQNLSQKITNLKLNNPHLGAVFIDYIQKIKNKNRKQFGTRQLELQDTSATILETVKTNSLPIILGAQLGRDKSSPDKVKLENLRESGDLENDANVVFGIFNPSMEDSQKQFGREIEIDITLLKNRNAEANQTIKLIFDRPILKIKDKKSE